MGFASDDLGYLVDLGLPQPTTSAFARDPEIKREVVFTGAVMRPASTLVRRRQAAVQAAVAARQWETLTERLPTYRSMLTELADPVRAPEIFAVREQIRSWRFYDGFRTDLDAPARRPQVGTRTPVLADDGSDLAAALQTIHEEDPRRLERVIADAFDGATLQVTSTGGLFELELRQPGMLRPLRSAELSDGTLRYLLWIAALLTMRPPALMVLNEPETSLHPDLLPALARLIREVSERTQTVFVSHSRALIDLLTDRGLDEREAGEAVEIELVKDLGETRVPGLGLLTTPGWDWGRR
ncbi:AAA family ATPase [Leekyejoonella antrihumi]|uniref:AAA family ATPase n=1 Tax=Leekyejoonella antrihumi TaxID=1660198 RepID=UPI00319E6374